MAVPADTESVAVGRFDTHSGMQALIDQRMFGLEQKRFHAIGVDKFPRLAVVIVVLQLGVLIKRIEEQKLLVADLLLNIDDLAKGVGVESNQRLAIILSMAVVTMWLIWENSRVDDASRQAALDAAQARAKLVKIRLTEY